MEEIPREGFLLIGRCDYILGQGQVIVLSRNQFLSLFVLCFGGRFQVGKADSKADSPTVGCSLRKVILPISLGLRNHVVAHAGAGSSQVGGSTPWAATSQQQNGSALKLDSLRAPWELLKSSLLKGLRATQRQVQSFSSGALPSWGWALSSDGKQYCLLSGSLRSRCGQGWLPLRAISICFMPLC